MTRSHGEEIEKDVWWASRGNKGAERKLLVRAFDRYYSKVEGEDCFYCGRQEAKNRDHAYPLSKMALLDDPRQAPADLMVVVPCCTRCNLALRDRVFTSMQERKEFLFRWRRKPTRKFTKVEAGE